MRDEGFERLREQLNVTYHRDATLQRACDRRFAPVDAGTDGDQVRPRKRRVAELAGRERDLRQLASQRAIDSPVSPSPSTTTFRPFNSTVHQRSFSVDNPTSTSIIVIIQNRTTTWFSFQPFNS